MNMSTLCAIKYMNRSYFSKARYTCMIGAGFKILGRTPVPKLPPSYPLESGTCACESLAPSGKYRHSFLAQNSFAVWLPKGCCNLSKNLVHNGYPKHPEEGETPLNRNNKIRGNRG